MNSKSSINLKLFFSFSAIVLLVISTIWILNTTVLEKYYLNYKEKSLVKTFFAIDGAYSITSGDITSDELADVETKQNIDIVIQNGEKTTIYTTSKDFSRDTMYPISDFKNPIDNKFIENMFSSDKKYFVETIRDKRLHNDFVALFGRLSNGYIVAMRSPVESIKESVDVSNRFLLIIGLIAITLSSILAYIVSKRFTKPITELNDIAKKMSKLDFSKKYESLSNDEIGDLGNSINTLSKNLEIKINELREINIELEKDIEEKSKLAEMRSEFVSDVSHELKTPIALIQGYAEGLTDGIATTDEDKKYYLEVILDEANKMGTLTHELLDLSNLEYGKNSLNIEEFNINDLVLSVIKKDDIIFSENEINITFNQTENPIIVFGDVFRIEQVLSNYINNAIKNVDENKNIKVSVERKESVARISVYNSGKNIEKENLTRIWNKFFKVDASRNRELSGSGIGLSLVKAIMDQHKNKYGVQNTLGGVEFWFELNIAKQ